eukprot:gene15635-17871_t
MSSFKVISDKNVAPTEVANLMASVGWGKETNYNAAEIERSLSAYPIIAYCRDSDGVLVGYISAFTDGAFSTFVGDRGVLSRKRFPYAKTSDVSGINAQCGMTSLFHSGPL